MEKGLQTLLYLQVRKSRVPGEEDFEHNWYVIDESMSCISEEPRLSAKLPRDTISAYYDDPTSGSEPILLLCGGRRFFTDTDWNYQGISSDHDNPMSSEVWSFGIRNYFRSKLPRMILRRASGNACAIVVNNKLYVFGGVQRLPRTTPCPWAEVVSLTGHTPWFALEPPPYVGLMPQVSACFQFNLDTDETNERRGKETHTIRKSILVYFHIIGSIYAFLLDTNKWIMFDPVFGTSYENLVILAETNILLATKNSVLCGYDLLSKEWFKGPVKDLNGNQLRLPMLQNQDQPHSFHLVPLNSSQGNLGMLWVNRCDKTSPFHVYCMNCTVYRKDSSLVAELESTKEFEIVDADALVCCLPVTIGRKLQSPSVRVDEHVLMDSDWDLGNYEEDTGGVWS